MDMRVRILEGFARGVEGTAVPLSRGYDVTVTYPEGHVSDGMDLSGVTENLYYYADELEFLDGANA